MTSQQVRITGVARMTAVLSLLLGLLAMHGIVSGHHLPLAASSSNGSGSLSTTLEGSGPGGNAMPGLHEAASAASATSRVAADVRHNLTGTRCEGCFGDAVTLLCLAVLTVGAAAFVGLFARPSGRPPARAPQSRLPLVRAGPPLRLRSPDPVVDLCISRT